VWVTVAINMIGFGIVIPIIPLYAQRFHASASEATLLIAVYSGAALIFSPLWGRISDRFGRRRVLLVSLVGTAVGSLLTGLAGGLVLLFIGRVIDGASGSTVSVAQATVGDLATDGQRARLFGLLGAAFGLGFVAGPAIGALAAVGGPRVPFYVAAGIAGLNALVAFRRLPETHRLPETGLAGGAPVRSHPTLRSEGVAPLLIVSFCALSAFSAFEATLALYGHRHFGLGIGSSAGTFAVVGIALVVVQGGLVRPLVARLGEERTLDVGLGANVVGLALFAFARSWALAVPALAVLTVGQALVQTTMASTLSGRAGPDRRGQLLGLQQSAGGLGRVVGPAFGGALLGTAASGAPYILGAVLCAVALLTILATRAAAVRSPGHHVTIK
jgi:DHA1 family tetracycline resistance protein-like MFS transporter